MSARLVENWRARPASERLMLGGGALLAIVLLAYAYIWLPIQRELDQLRPGLPQLRAQAAQLQRDAAEVDRLRARPAAPASTGSLAALIEQRARAAGLRERIGAITPQDAGRVRVQLPRVGFDAWLGWIGELQTAHGVRIESVDIEATDEVGMVKIDAVLAGA